jgi:hypothetical protein
MAAQVVAIPTRERGGKRGMIKQEIELCQSCDKRDKRNYYNWTHRQAVVRWAQANGMEELVSEEVVEVKR